MQGFRNTLVLTFDEVDSTGEERRARWSASTSTTCTATSAAGCRRTNPTSTTSPASRTRSTRPASAHPDDGLRPHRAHVGSRSPPPRTPQSHRSRRTPRPGAEITLHRTIYPERDLSIVDILPAGCSKASALLLLAEMRGVALTEILAIGDNWNDVPMLRLAGRSVLMANAPDELKTLAANSRWQIAPSHDEDGVAVAIEAAFAPVLQ